VTRLQPILHKHRSLLGHVVLAVAAILVIFAVMPQRDRPGYVLGVVFASLVVLTVPLSESEKE
jgi:hypothetical protein